MASAQCQKPNTAVEVCQQKHQHKPNITVDVCQPKSQHSSFGKKISEITSKAFKGHHSRPANNQNQLQCYSQTHVESLGQNGSKTETHHYLGQSQAQHDRKHGVSKTQITVTMVQAQITHTNEEPYPFGTTTTCFGGHAKKNGEFNNKKEMNLFRRIQNGISRHNNNEGSSSSSSDSESDNEKCPKTKK